MRRAVLTTTATSALIVLLLAFKPHHSGPVGAAPRPVPATPPPVGGTAPSGGSTGGTYTGDTIGTPYGPVQVEATVRAGRLTGVRVLQVPSGSGRDQQIAATAVPALTREALSAGNAHIDAVSGASYTSQGYIRSLQSALDRAGA
ncbi:FMN-binding protein [Streptomyces hebeiensis]